MWAHNGWVRGLGGLLLCGALLAPSGCISEDAAEELAEIAEDILDAVDEIQIVDPRGVDLPDVLVDRGDTVVLRQDVTIVNVIEEDLIVEELPNINLLGFENLTGFDVYVTFYVEDTFQGAYVYDGDTLLLEYDCLSDFEIVGEDDIDPVSGLLVDAFDFTDAVFFNPDDFLCGDAVIITLDPDAISVTTELIDLTR